MSQLEVDKVIPQSGTTLTIGDSGDTITIASGATLSGDLNASNLTSGTVPDARITGTYTGITGLDLTDNSKIRLGTGNDLEIFHNGSNSYISDNGTGSLYIRGSSEIRLTNPSASENYAVFNDNGAVSLYYDNSLKFETTSTGATVTGTAKVSSASSGVTPSVNADDLFVESSGSTGITIGSGTANFGRINFGDSGDANIGIIQYEHTTNAMAFTTNASEAIRIDSSGRLLVGKTVTTRTVAGAELRPDGFIRGTKDSAHAFDCVRTTDDGDVIRLYKDNTHTGSIGVAGSNPFLANPNSRGISLGSNLVPCNSSGTAVDNLSDIGTSSARWNDLYLGGGLYVGGTGTANKLSDYEEGTWSPKLGNETTAVYSNQTGWYRKIGETVFIYFSVSLSSKGDISGAYTKIANLPFNGASGGNRFGSGQIHAYRLGSSKHIQGIEFGGSTVNVGWILTGGGSTTGYLNTSFVADNTFFEGFATYKTA